MFSVVGTLAYYTDYCVLYIDGEVAEYYRSLIPKAWYPKPPMTPAHVTVVRRFKECIPDATAWAKYQGGKVEIQVEPGVRWDETYFWLDCWSEELGRIRQELGLGAYREGFSRYHITIANRK